MGWIVGIVVVIGFIWLMVTNVRFRVVGFWLIGLAALGVFLLWQGERTNHRRFMAEMERERTAIPHDALEFRGMSLSQGDYPMLTGTVVNNSDHPVQSLKIRASLQDCPVPPQSGGCLVTGEDDVEIYVEIPPHQARSVSGAVSLSNAARPTGAESWDMRLIEVRAKLDP